MAITLSTLQNYSAQEVFDKVVNHLLTQMERSVDPKWVLEPQDGSPYNGCLYRYQDGDRLLKCAAGCLISDEEYSEDMEGKAYFVIRKVNDHKKLIENLQSIHDDCEPSEWEKKLKAEARKQGLNFNYKPETTDEGQNQE